MVIVRLSKNVFPFSERTFFPVTADDCTMESALSFPKSNIMASTTFLEERMKRTARGKTSDYEQEV